MSARIEELTAPAETRQRLNRGLTEHLDERWPAVGNANAPGRKQCTLCRHVKTLDEFRRNKSGGQGRDGKCRDCRNRLLSEKRSKLLEDGLCIDCTAPLNGARRRCAECNARAAGWVRAKVSSGVCSRCPKQAVPGRTRCEECRQRYLEMVAARRSAGICKACPRPAPPGQPHCTDCRAAETRRVVTRLKDAYWLAIREGRCTGVPYGSCSSEPREGRRTCADCGNKHLWRRRAVRHAAQLQLTSCHLCDKPLNTEVDEWEADHLVPRSLGGGDEWTNILPACRQCNRDRGNTPLDEWHRRGAFHD